VKWETVSCQYIIKLGQGFCETYGDFLCKSNIGQWHYKRCLIFAEEINTTISKRLSPYVPAKPSSYIFHDIFVLLFIPFDAHCCHMGTAIKHSVPNWGKPSFVIFDIWALWRSALSPAKLSKITNVRLNLVRDVTLCSLYPYGSSEHQRVIWCRRPCSFCLLCCRHAYFYNCLAGYSYPSTLPVESVTSQYVLCWYISPYSVA